MKRDLDEIEVDVEKPAPLSKKQKRLEKKGKLPEKPDETKKPKRTQFSIWIGNLPFSTLKSELERFLTGRGEIDLENITRVHLDQKKGFAYVDFISDDDLQKALGLSEQDFGGRRVLIKNANSYEGRPSKQEAEQKNPPSRILFVGNLTFDTTDEQLELHFQHCGTISRIRTATFQDSGKCKGFTFIDFQDIDSATKALKDPRCRKLNGRLLRMEYGEDRSNRKVKKREEPQQEAVVESSAPRAQVPIEKPQEQQSSFGRESTAERRQRREKRENKGKERKTSGATLANVKRAPLTAKPTGKKTKFD